VGAGNGAHVAGRHAGADLDARQVVADLDGVDAEAARHRGEIGEGRARHGHAVEGEAQFRGGGHGRCLRSGRGQGMAGGRDAL
jgi:hypothetical protein